MMFGDPEAAVAERLGMLRQIDGVADRLVFRRAMRNGGLVEDGEAKRGGLGHGSDLGQPGCAGNHSINQEKGRISDCAA